VDTRLVNNLPKFDRLVDPVLNVNKDHHPAYHQLYGSSSRTCCPSAGHPGAAHCMLRALVFVWGPAETLIVGCACGLEWSQTAEGGYSTQRLPESERERKV
jgi:hypothetical protein